jgi:hypothetical protein
MLLLLPGSGLARKARASSLRGLVSAPGRRLLFSRRTQVRGVERREALPVSPRLSALRPFAIGTRASRRSTAAFFDSGPRFPGHFRPDQPAPGGETVVSPGRSPGPPQGGVTSPARRNRIPPRSNDVS